MFGTAVFAPDTWVLLCSICNKTADTINITFPSFEIIVLFHWLIEFEAWKDREEDGPMAHFVYSGGPKHLNTARRVGEKVCRVPPLWFVQNGATAQAGS